MTFTHKLARRLSLIRFAVPAVLVSTGLLAGCLDQVASNTFDPIDSGGATPDKTGLIVAPHAITIETGQRAQFKATAPDVIWTASSGGMVSPAGVFTSGTPGTYRVIAHYRGHEVPPDSATVTVVAPQPSVAALVVTPETITLAPGDTLTFAVAGRLADGSSVPVGVTWNGAGGTIDAGGKFTAASVTGTYRVVATHSSGKADTASVTVSTSAPPVSEPAVNPPVSNPAVPPPVTTTSTGRAAAMEWIGSVLPVTAARSSLTQQLDAAFVTRSDQHWAAEGTGWVDADYYDRAYSHYLYYLRGGDQKYADRASGIAVDYRTHYLEANGFASSPHWAQLEGIALHYWMTGDQKSKTAVVETAKRTFAGFTIPQVADSNFVYGDGRVEARALVAALLAWKLGDTSRDWGSEADARAAVMIKKQRANGSYRMAICQLNECPSGMIWGNSNFMLGMQASAMAKYYRLRRQDPAVAQFIVRAAGFLKTQWDETQSAFRYWDVPPRNTAQGEADVDGLVAVAFAFAAKYNHDQTMGAFADHVYDAALRAGWLDGGKQYNQFAYDLGAFQSLRSGEPGAH